MVGVILQKSRDKSICGAIWLGLLFILYAVQEIRLKPWGKGGEEREEGGKKEKEEEEKEEGEEGRRGERRGEERRRRGRRGLLRPCRDVKVESDFCVAQLEALQGGEGGVRLLCGLARASSSWSLQSGEHIGHQEEFDFTIATGLEWRAHYRRCKQQLQGLEQA
ncbi:unnamed protein product [Victoria cruziana]